jgi:hypothetical protein
MGAGASTIASINGPILPVEWTLEQVIARAGEFGIGETTTTILRSKQCDGAMVTSMNASVIHDWGLAESETEQLTKLVQRCQEYQLERKTFNSAVGPAVPGVGAVTPCLPPTSNLSGMDPQDPTVCDPDAFDILPERLSAPKSVQEHLDQAMAEFKACNNMSCDEIMPCSATLDLQMPSVLKSVTACEVELNITATVVSVCVLIEFPAVRL